MLVGVHTQFEAQARESLTVNLGNCGPVGCASPPCPVDPFPACTDGLCQALPGCSERTLEMCDLDGLCQVYNARDCQSPASPFMPRVCGQSGATTACAAQPTCRVSPAGQMLYFEDGCVPAVGYDQPCPIACE
jgi:hypothetical protein